MKIKFFVSAKEVAVGNIPLRDVTLQVVAGPEAKELWPSEHGEVSFKLFGVRKGVADKLPLGKVVVVDIEEAEEEGAE